MVTALGIDVRRAFTLVFAIGGLAAGIAGVLSSVYFTTVDPQHGTALVISAFIVVVIGGLGSLRGTAMAAVVVGLVQQYANYYASAALVISASCCCSARFCSFGRAVSRGASREAALPSPCSRRSPSSLSFTVDLPYIFSTG